MKPFWKHFCIFGNFFAKDFNAACNALFTVMRMSLVTFAIREYSDIVLELNTCTLYTATTLVQPDESD